MITRITSTVLIDRRMAEDDQWILHSANIHMVQACGSVTCRKQGVKSIILAAVTHKHTHTLSRLTDFRIKARVHRGFQSDGASLQ